MTTEAQIPQKYQLQVATLLKELSDTCGSQALAYSDQRKLREAHQKQLADIHALHNVQSAEMQQGVLKVDGCVSRLHMEIAMLASNIFGTE